MNFKHSLFVPSCPKPPGNFSPYLNPPSFLLFFMIRRSLLPYRSLIGNGSSAKSLIQTAAGKNRVAAGEADPPPGLLISRIISPRRTLIYYVPEPRNPEQLVPFGKLFAEAPTFMFVGIRSVTTRHDRSNC